MVFNQRFRFTPALTKGMDLAERQKNEDLKCRECHSTMQRNIGPTLSSMIIVLSSARFCRNFLLLNIGNPCLPSQQRWRTK